MIKGLTGAARLHYLQGRSDKGKKTSLTFKGPQGTGKTAAARVLAEALGLNFCEISYGPAALFGTHETMGKVAECLNQSNATNPVIIINEVDLTLAARPDLMAELLLFSDPNQEEMMDHFLGINVPLSRCMIIYAVNDYTPGNPINNEAFKSRATTLYFHGFEMEYRFQHATGPYLERLLQDFSQEGISKEDMIPAIGHWFQSLRAEEQAYNVTLGSMRDVELAVDRIFGGLSAERSAQEGQSPEGEAGGATECQSLPVVSRGDGGDSPGVREDL